jgi:hypothetical protein
VDSLGDSNIALLAVLGVVFGLFLLARGLADYRSLVRLSDISTSPIGSLAAGEVRVSGVIEPAEVMLVSLLQSVSCVYYRSTIDGGRQGGSEGYTEERSVGFRVRDPSGSLRVFPRDARFDAPTRLSAETSLMGDEPSGLAMRTGGSTRTAEVNRDLAIAALLEIRRDARPDPRPGDRGGDTRHRYRETRLEPGDAVTIVGRALPFSDLDDPTSADVGYGISPLIDDPEIAADLAAARAAGTLAPDAIAAWGNAAIPGFGIGRPTVPPTLDPAADRLPLATADEAARTERSFAIAPETLVLASSPDARLLVAHGVPGAIVGRRQAGFVVGLLGAVMAIASAMLLALSVTARMSA